MNPIDLANTKVSIHQVCKLFDIDVPEFGTDARSFKVHCPMGAFYHSDGGDEPTMRVYSDTNSAYCFRCSTAFSPVWMYSQVQGVRPMQAAKELLDMIGHKPPSATELWERYNNPEQVVPDTASLAIALKTYCARQAKSWETAQFDTDVAAKLAKCLMLLEYVLTEEMAEKWLATTKVAMKQVLEGK